MPFKLSVKYYSIPKHIADKYQLLYIYEESFPTKKAAIEKVFNHFYGIKNDVFYENGLWKIVLYLYQFPIYIYNQYVHSKKIAIFDNENAAKRYAEKKIQTQLYIIEYTKESVNFAEIDGN